MVPAYWRIHKKDGQREGVTIGQFITHGEGSHFLYDVQRKRYIGILQKDIVGSYLRIVTERIGFSVSDADPGARISLLENGIGILCA